MNLPSPVSISRKISLLGDFAVGKTSTVARAVRNTFSSAYLTTVGVKVDSKTVETGSAQVRLVVWDIAGANVIDQMRRHYIGGSHGLILVADGTRADTLDTALTLRQQAQALLNRTLPAILLLNKNDLVGEWEIHPEHIERLAVQLPVFSTSALNGNGVEAAFSALADIVVEADSP